MSANNYKTIVLDDKKYKLVPIEDEKFLTVYEVAELTKLSVHTVRKKREILTKGVHYTYSNGNNGKLLFDDSVVDFLKEQGGTSENIKRNDTSTKRQPVSLDTYFDKFKKA